MRMSGGALIWIHTSSLALLALAAVTAFAAEATAQNESGVPGRFRGAIIAHRERGFTRKLLALTIDDGPDRVITPRILDALKSHHAHATFFVLGASAARHPELLRRMVAEGHAIGNHTYYHMLHPDKREARLELEITAQYINQAIGNRPTLFRPPGGNRSSWTARLAREQGYTVVLWTVSTADTATHDPAVIANNVIHTPSPGDIVLMHDSSTKAATAEALPRILDELGRKGWQFVTVPELLQEWSKFEVNHMLTKAPNGRSPRSRNGR